MKTVKRCRVKDLAFLLTLITSSSVLVCLLTSGCAKSNTETPQAPQEISEEKIPEEKISEEEISEEKISEESCVTFDQTEAGSRAVLEYNGVEFAFRYCPADYFIMGSPEDEEPRFAWEGEFDEQQHTVNIGEGFWICETETTQAQWDAVGGEKRQECDFKGAKLPVETVTWYESDAFVKKLNDLGTAPEGWRWALPTEEQWEYACRAGTKGPDYGTSIDECAWCWFSESSKMNTREVGTKKPNNWGIYDMLGNVWEWTCSKYAEEPASEYDDAPPFVSRGGCWDSPTRFCRPACRRSCSPTDCNRAQGFRCVLVRSQAGSEAEKASFEGNISGGTDGDSTLWTGDFEAGARKTLTYNGVEFAFRYCPVGSFTTENPANKLEPKVGEQRSVTIDEGFWICETETTQAQWDAVGIKKEFECEQQGAKLPVDSVSLYETDMFIMKLNDLGTAPEGWRWALPTEEQWEYACRAGTTDLIDESSYDEYAWHSPNSEIQTHDVGTKRPNAWGIYDMLGNVEEWTGSKFELNTPEYDEGIVYVCRGGSIFDMARDFNAATYDYWKQSSAARDLGFRAVLVRCQSE